MDTKLSVSPNFSHQNVVCSFIPHKNQHNFFLFHLLQNSDKISFVKLSKHELKFLS